KAIERGIDYLRERENGSGNWEDSDRRMPAMEGGWTALAMLALLNAGVKPDDPIIERGLKTLRRIPADQTYVVALQTTVLAETGRNEDRERIQDNVNWLIRAMIKDNGVCYGWTYSDTGGRGRISDNSNTQYALLGLHAGKMAGAKIDRAIWEMIRAYYINTQ